MIARVAGVPFPQAGPHSHLEHDLHLEALLKVELLLQLEGHFHMPLPQSLASWMHAPGEVLKLVRQRIEDSSVAPTELEPEAGTSTAQAAAPTWGRAFAGWARADEAQWLHAGLVARAARALVRQLVQFYAWGWFSFEAHDVEWLPPGAFIVAANHTSHLDSGAVVTACGRRGADLFIMAARDYFFRTRPKAWFFHTFFKVLPLDREQKAMEGLRLARAVLRAGKPVLIYPEGRRSSTGQLQPFKSGIGLLGVQLGVPIVPCSIQGTFAALPKGKSWPRPSKVCVRFGPPVTMESYRALQGCLDRGTLYQRIADDVRGVIERLGNCGGRA